MAFGILLSRLIQAKLEHCYRYGVWNEKWSEIVFVSLYYLLILARMLA